jgi:hypothetical protein
MNDDDTQGETDAAVGARVAHLRQERQDLDDAIAALEARPQRDQLQIARLKKRKLHLRDQIAMLEDGLTPDIIA